MSAWLQRLAERFRSRSGMPAAVGEAAHPAPPLERDSAIVGTHRTLQSRVNLTLAWLFFGGLAVALLSWYYGRLLSQPDTRRNRAASEAASRAEGDTPLPPLNWLPANTPNASAPATRSTSAASSSASSYAIGSVLGPAPNGLSLAPDDNEFVLDTGGAAGAARTPAPPERELGGAVFSRAESMTTNALPTDLSGVFPNGTRADSAGTPLAQRLRTERTAPVQATLLATQRLLLPKGASLDCTLQTAIDSSLPGLTTCLTAVDTYSADGTVVLLERGTLLVGETQGDAQQGQSRLFVLWTEARTPKGVVIPLDSPGTDELGRSGLSGQIKRHFWERFGSAILLTVIDGAVQSAVNRRSSSSVTINPASTRDVATEVLRSTINIPPTITKRNGDRIQILVARDLDFRSVYTLSAP